MSLSLHEVSVRYGQTHALQNVDLRFEVGVTALLGVNGAGKSTLLAVAAGLRPPDHGSAAIASANMFDARSRSRAMAQVAIMPQLTHFPRSMTAAEVVTYMGWLKGLDTNTARRRATESLLHVGLQDVANRKMRTLSGGMSRRVALAQAIVAEPAVLLLDEPSTGLDPSQRRMMVELIRRQKGTVVLSSHVVEDVSDLATRIVVLDRGRVVFDDKPAALGALGAASSVEARSPLEAGFLSLVDGTPTQ